MDILVSYEETSEMIEPSLVVVSSTFLPSRSPTRPPLLVVRNFSTIPRPREGAGLVGSRVSGPEAFVSSSTETETEAEASWALSGEAEMRKRRPNVGGHIVPGSDGETRSGRTLPMETAFKASPEAPE